MRRKIINCPCCGNEIDANWTYCPYCGCFLGLKRFEDFFGFERDYIRDFFEDFDKTFRKLIKEFSKPLEFEKESEPYIRGGGVSIVIKSESGKKPKIYVKTFGDYKELEPKIKESIKKKVGIEEVEEKEEEKKVREVKVTEEPEVKIKRDLQKIEIEVDLPDVESSKDIEITELEESIEIRAYAKDKAYFKIISKPKNKTIVEKKFEKGKLRIVLE